MPSANNKPVFSEVKRSLAALGRLDALLSEIASADSGGRRAVESAAKALINAEVLRTLATLSIEELNREKLGIRISALRSAGYENIRSIAEAPLRRIINIVGIGEDTARIIKNKAMQMQAQLRDSAFIRISVDDRSKEADALLRALYIVLETDEIRSRAAEAYEKSHANIAALMKTASPAGSALSWLLSSSSKKSSAVAALKGVAVLLNGPYAASAKSIIRKYNSIANIDPDVYWGDFASNSPRYYAALEKLMPELNLMSKASGLPDELAEEIQNVSFSTAGLRCTLRSYQEFGVKYILKGGSVLLGDEMGLGKTVQAIAAMVALRNAGGSRFMVVCPASVLVNWCREVKLHSDLSVVKIHGSDRAAVNQWLREGGVAVTTYETISRFSLPEVFRFSLLVADEAHYVKNPQAIRTRALLKMKRHASRALFMTGTPLENDVEEMCFLLSCLQPEMMSKLRNVSYLSAAPRFRADIAPVYFRRTREDVLKELPDLIESEEWSELNAAEAMVYFRDTMRREFMAIRRVSWSVGDMRKSSKACRLFEICQMAAEENRKVLVFSFFLDTLDKVTELLGDRCVGLITGAVSPKQRQSLVDSFSAAPGGSVLAAQVQAGGTGLNIQAASVVVLCEPQIKPSIENQAISRAYRMGQPRSVLVYRLLCENTIDERIMEILADKQLIFDSYAEESVSGEESLRLSAKSTSQLVEEEFLRVSAAAGSRSSTAPVEGPLQSPPAPGER